MASGQSSIVESYDDSHGSIVDNHGTVHAITGVTRPRRSSLRQTPSQSAANLDAGDAQHAFSRLSGRPSTSSSPSLQTEALKQRGSIPGGQANSVPQHISNVNPALKRRTSSRIKTATMKRILMAERSDDEDDVGYNRYPATRQSSTVSGSGSATGNVVLKIEPTEQDVQIDSWKTGWLKVDKWAKELPTAQSSVKGKAATDRKVNTEGCSSRKGRPRTAQKQPSTVDTRVVCPKGCGMTFGRPTDARRHAEQTSGCGSSQKPFVCGGCGGGFSRNDALRRHLGLTEGRQQHCSGIPRS